MTSRYCFARLSSSGSSLGGSGCSKISRITSTPLFYIRQVQGHSGGLGEALVSATILQDHASRLVHESEVVWRVVERERRLHSAPLPRVGRRRGPPWHPTSLCSHSPQFLAWGDRFDESSNPNTVPTRSWEDNLSLSSIL